MKRIWLSSLVPPLAVCRYGCAGCCAAPIGVMWIAGIISMIYGFAGGPAEINGISWTTVLLGAALWIIASTWAMTVIRGVNADKADPNCSNRRSPVCRITTDGDGNNYSDDDDPMSEIKNLTQ